MIKKLRRIYLITQVEKIPRLKFSFSNADFRIMYVFKKVKVELINLITIRFCKIKQIQRNVY